VTRLPHAPALETGMLAHSDTDSRSADSSREELVAPIS
jgi:hypothetical protein